MATAEEKKILQRMKKTSKGAYKRAKTAEPKVKGQQLPGGIVKGIARFSDFKLGLDKNSNPYIMLTGIVVTPEEFEGTRATRSHFLSESEWKTMEERYEELFSDLQLLGINTSEMKDATVLEDSLAHLAELKDLKSPFYFNTWKRNAESDTIVFIQGVVEDGTVPDSKEEEEEEEEEEEYEDDEEVEDEEKAEDADSEEEADDDEEEAEEDEEEYEDESDVEEDEEGEGWEPEKGDVYDYGINSKAIAFPCEVTSVNHTKETVSIKRQKDNKVFKDVSWDKLQDAEE